MFETNYDKIDSYNIDLIQIHKKKSEISQKNKILVEIFAFKCG